MAEKFEKKKEENLLDKQYPVQDPLMLKIKSIKESKMPEEQKESMLKELGVVTGAIPEASIQGIPFDVFAQIKKIPKTMQKAMQLYPKAKNVSLASLEEWESIFKDF